MFTCIELYCINNCSNQSWNQVTGSAIYAESGRVGSRVSIVKPCLDALVVIILVVVVVAVAVATKQVQNKHKYNNRRHAHCTIRQDKKLSCRREPTRSAPAPEYWNKGDHGQFFGGGTWRALGARAYNEGLWAELPAGSRGRAPGQGVKGENPPEAESFLALRRATDRANLYLLQYFQQSITIR